MSPSNAGQHLLSIGALSCIGSLGSGFIVRRTGKVYWLIVGGSLIGVISAGLLTTWSARTAEYVVPLQPLAALADRVDGACGLISLLG